MLDFCPMRILCYLLRRSIVHMLRAATKQRDVPIDLSLPAVSRDPFEETCEDASPIDKKADRDGAAILN